VHRRIEVVTTIDQPAERAFAEPASAPKRAASANESASVERRRVSG
jgi:hypothetical protein